MSIRVIKPDPPDPHARDKRLRLVASLCLSDFPDADDACLVKHMKMLLRCSGDSALSADCEKALAEARAEAHAAKLRRRNERACQLYACFILLLLIGLVLWAIFSR